MNKKIFLGSIFLILFLSIIIFFYFKSYDNKNLIRKDEKINLIEKETMKKLKVQI